MARIVQTALAGLTLLLAAGATGCSTFSSTEESRSNLSANSSQALDTLAATNPAAKAVASQAVAVLVFPNIVKAGLAFGGAYGEGELRRGSTMVGRYRSYTGSWGLQAGAQSYSYALFLMNQDALDHLEMSDGWEIGVGPTVVVIDAGVAENLSTSTLSDDAYAFIFDQQGLMAGVSIEGTKISRMD
ncbi:MAG: lipid-binding SYLF domain-containing protein [Henriciella sp.]|uniref:lipid-binding SYLF domain-containing protein n=1 Tax=Henriciella sp. TaxID=1968823 RepID=UPI0032EB5EB8